MKQQRGQPKKFRDWGKGQNKIFNDPKLVAQVIKRWVR